MRFHMIKIRDARVGNELVTDAGIDRRHTIRSIEIGPELVQVTFDRGATIYPANARVDKVIRQ